MVNKISSTEISNYKNQPTEALIAEAIPLDVLKTILSYLDDMGSAILVNKFWKKAVVEIKTPEANLIKNFILSLKSTLNPTQSLSLLQLANDFSVVKFLLNKPSTLKLQQIVLNTLKNPKIDLDSLEKLHQDKIRPKLFEDVFTLARFCRKTDDANAKPRFLREFELTKKELHQNIAAAVKPYLGDGKSHVFREIMKEYIKKEQHQNIAALQPQKIDLMLSEILIPLDRIRDFAKEISKKA